MKTYFEKNNNFSIELYVICVTISNTVIQYNKYHDKKFELWKRQAQAIVFLNVLFQEKN